MDLKLKTLSPVFIGSGEEYNGLSYIADGSRIRFYDLHGIMGDLDQEQRERFIRFIEHSGSRSNLRGLLREVFGADAHSGLDSHCRYELHVAGRIGGRIRGFIAEGEDVYIPGSEVKGTIRTSILYHFLNLLGEQMPERLRTGGNSLKEIESEFEGAVFRTSKNDDAKYDVLKLLMIRDSEPKPAGECLFVSNIEILNVHEKQGRRNGRIAIPCQLCREEQTFICQDMQVSDDPLVASQLGFSANQRWMLQYTGGLPNFFQCCYESSQKLLQAEIDYFSRVDGILEVDLLLNNLEVESQDEAIGILDQVVVKLEAIQEKNRANTPVIRLGGSQGYFSTTISLVLREFAPDIYEEVARTMAKRGVPPSQFPRTRRLVVNSSDEYDTLGWVQLSTDSD